MKHTKQEFKKISYKDLNLFLKVLVTLAAINLAWKVLVVAAYLSLYFTGNI